MWSNPNGINHEPWLSDKQRYEQNWGSQFSLTVYFILVPNAFLEEAKGILDSEGKPAEFYTDKIKINDTFCLFCRQYKGDHIMPGIQLARRRIPSIAGLVEMQHYKQTLVTYHCVWDSTTGYFEPREDRLELTKRAGNINYSPIDILTEMAGYVEWESLIKYCQKQKTLALLKGNSDGLSETPQQSQDRIAEQRRAGILQQHHTWRTP